LGRGEDQNGGSSSGFWREAFEPAQIGFGAGNGFVLAANPATVTDAIKVREQERVCAPTTCRPCWPLHARAWALPRCPAWYVAHESVRNASVLPVLANWALPTQEIHAVYSSPRLVTTKVSSFVSWLQEQLGERWWADPKS